MSLANGAQAQDESAAVLGRAGLVGMPDDAWIEQGRCLKRIFVEKISSDKGALPLIQLRVRLERIFHLCGACFENIDQIPVAAFKILEHLTQMLRRGFGI